MDIARQWSRSYFLWTYLYFVYEKTWNQVRKRINSMGEGDRNSLEVFFIEQVFETFEMWKNWCQKNIYNNSGLTFLFKLIQLITTLGVGEFMGKVFFLK